MCLWLLVYFVTRSKNCLLHLTSTHPQLLLILCLLLFNCMEKPSCDQTYCWKSNLVTNVHNSSTQCCFYVINKHVTHSQLLEGLKCESKWKTAEEGGVGMRSLAHNTWRGRGACWSSGMGVGRIDKLIHSHGPAHNPHKMVSA